MRVSSVGVQRNRCEQLVDFCVVAEPLAKNRAKAKADRSHFGRCGGSIGGLEQAIGARSSFEFMWPDIGQRQAAPCKLRRPLTAFYGRPACNAVGVGPGIYVPFLKIKKIPN